MSKRKSDSEAAAAATDEPKADPVEAWIQAAVAVAMDAKIKPTIEQVLGEVKRQLDEAEAKLPGDDTIGLSELFVEKVVRQAWNAAAQSEVLEGIVGAVMKTFRDGKGPTRRNRVALS